MSRENKPSFIKIGDTRIRLSNIKCYDIHEESTYYYNYKLLTIQTYQGNTYKFTDDNDDAIDLDEAVRKLDLYLT